MCGELTGREGFVSSRRKDWVCGSQEYRHGGTFHRINSEGINNGARKEKIPGIPGFGCRR
jgi:hypothetical protein